MFENHQYYNCEITLDDGSTYKVNANWIHNNGLDNWKDWRCSVGSTRLHIDKDLNVYSGQCKNNFLGNLKTEWEILNDLTVCNLNRCSGCTDDLITKKHKK